MSSLDLLCIFQDQRVSFLCPCAIPLGLLVVLSTSMALDLACFPLVLCGSKSNALGVPEVIVRLSYVEAFL